MNHLKRFNELNTFDNFLGLVKLEEEVLPIVSTVKDICLELTDEKWDESSARFTAEVRAIGPVRDGDDKLGIFISIKRPEGFIRSDIEETLSRIDGYLSDEGYSKYGRESMQGYEYNAIYRYKR